MIYINLTTNQFYFGQIIPSGTDWVLVRTEEFNALLASGWQPTEYVAPYRVSKDTIVSRVLEAGKINDLILTINGLAVEQKFLWDNFAWFWSDNSTVTAIAIQLNLDPNMVLAKDPYI